MHYLSVPPPSVLLASVTPLTMHLPLHPPSGTPVLLLLVVPLPLPMPMPTSLLVLEAATTSTSAPVLLHRHLLKPICHLVGLLVGASTNEASSTTLLKPTAPHTSCRASHAALLASHAPLLPPSHIHLTSPTTSHNPSPGSRGTPMLFRGSRSKYVPKAGVVSACASAGEVFVLLR